MLHFLGTELDLEVDEVWECYDGPRLFAGHEVSGQTWLVSGNSPHAIRGPMAVCRSVASGAGVCPRRAGRGGRRLATFG